MASASPPASLQTGPTSVSLGLPSSVKNRPTSDPVPRGRRPDVLLAMAFASPASRRATNFLAIDPQRLVPRDRLELRIRRPLLAGHALQRPGEAVAVVDQLGHHRPLHAQPAGLHGVGGLAGDVDDPARLQVDLEPAVGVAELAGAVHHLVRLQCTRLGGEVVLGWSRRSPSGTSRPLPLRLWLPDTRAVESRRAGERPPEQAAPGYALVVRSIHEQSLSGSDGVAVVRRASIRRCADQCSSHFAAAASRPAAGSVMTHDRAISPTFFHFTLGGIVLQPRPDDRPR